MIARALEEDLRYGPDVTTLATVPADATTTASMVTREPGVIAGVDIALLVLDEVLGPDAIWSSTAWTTARGWMPVRRLLVVEAADARSADRRAHDAEPGVSPVGHRDDDRCVGRCRRGHHGKDPRHPQDAAWSARLAEVRGARRRRRQPPHGPRRRGADQGQPCRGGGFGGGRAARSPQQPRRTCRARWRSTRSSSSTRYWPKSVELVLLDNFPVWQTQIAVQRRAARSPGTKLESSGGLSLDTAAEYAGTGVDYLAVGALTHSVRVLDIGLDV